MSTTAFIVIALILIGLGAFLFLLWWWGYFFKAYYPDPSQSRFAHVEGVKLHYVTEGQGPPLLLVHGMGANIYCWRKLIPLLSKNFKVWALDLRGFGLSDKPINQPYDLKTQSEILLKFIHQEIGETCSLVGSSMGGAICLEASLSEPQTVTKLVLLSPAYDSTIVVYDLRVFRRFLKLFVGFANPWVISRVMKYIYAPKTSYSRADILNYMRPYARNTASIYALIDSMACVADPTLKNRIKNIIIPTLILWGRFDFVVAPTYAKYINESIPHSQLFIHETAGHHIQEEEPQWVTDKIGPFILTEDKITGPSV